MRLKTFFSATSALTLFVFLSLALVSCPTPDDGPDYTVEFGGTWRYNANPSNYQRYIFTDTTCSYVSTLPMPNGTRTYSITTYDETVNHIEMVITGQTGDLAVGTNIGDTLYFTYIITGNILQIVGDTTDYFPEAVAAASEQYIKQ